MELYSTNQQSPNVSLKEALFRGLPPDNGLYLPVNIPQLGAGFFDEIEKLDLQGIAFAVCKALFADEVNEADLRQIVKDAINFDAPLEEIDPQTYILELFHGPTLAFKDFGARFMARLMAHFLQREKKELNILVATSGDTGSAVANGFYEVDGIRVIVLYPKGKISPYQEKQITTLGKNIVAVEVDGTFDDCQALVKRSFLDVTLNTMINLTSANSINIGRLIPQSFYYFYAYAKLKIQQKPLIFSVPSGNFGNLCAGIIAYKMGLPVEKFIAATNINDIIPKYLTSGEYSPAPSKKTISNAMDVGNPSNFVRLKALFNQEEQLIKDKIWGAAYTDQQTLKAIGDISANLEYTLDPHTAIGYLGLQDYFNINKEQEHIGVVLATAHPSKFIEVVEKATDSKVIIPDRLRELLNRKKMAIPLKNDFEELKALLLGLASR
jgi:threonine synthase